jgi:hypothetical protein
LLLGPFFFVLFYFHSVHFLCHTQLVPYFFHLPNHYSPLSLIRSFFVVLFSSSHFVWLTCRILLTHSSTVAVPMKCNNDSLLHAVSSL